MTRAGKFVFHHFMNHESKFYAFLNVVLLIFLMISERVGIVTFER